MEATLKNAAAGPGQSRAGLENVVAMESSIAFVDGAAGELLYRGYSVPDLARERTFEDVTGLLWEGELPASPEALRVALARHRTLDDISWAIVEAMVEGAAPLEILRTLVSASSSRSEAGISREQQAVRTVSLLHAGVAAIAARRAGRPAPEFRDGDTAARGLLRALAGREPSAREERVLDAILVLHADHELNASTFAARVVAATEADLTGSVTAAIAALQGPKHGGANEDVAEMLDEIGEPARARAWAEAKLERYLRMSPEERRAPSARFAGFGHRVYKVDDPRAVALREMANRFVVDERGRRSLEIAEAVRGVVQSGLGLPLNVDYYSAVVYAGLGIEPAMFTSIFAASRVAGWCAHVLEQLGNNRLIRPRAEYRGPARREV